jgi:hypothetical protein
MRILRLAPTLALALLIPATAVVAQDAQEEFLRQSEILEQDLDRYVAARERERDAVDDLRELNVQLNRLFGDMSAPVSEMRRQESRVATSLDRAYQSLQETARARALIYDQMDRLAELAGQIEERPPEPIDQDNPVGIWEFRLDPIGVSALVELEFQTGGVNSGLVMVGTYRSSNGNRGTLRGSFANGQMGLEVMDSRQGKVADMNGSVGFQGRLEGTWQAVRTGLGPDRPSGGTWTGRRVASASEVSLD